MFSSVFGNFVDSLLGSLFEESWWCSCRKKIVKLTGDIPSCCSIAKKENREVCGFEPSECGLVCGKKRLSGSQVNLLSSSITSIFVFLGLFCKYWL